MKQILDLQPVDELSPQYLNAFRNTPWYQNALAHGVERRGKIITITLADIILSDRDKVSLVFDGKHECTDGNRKHKPNYDTIYRSPSAKVVTFMDKVQLAREANPNTFGDARFTPETIAGYTAALERLARTDQSISRVKGRETKAKHIWCRDTLTEFITSEEGLNALTLWTMFEGEGNPRIKNAKSARQAYSGIVQYLAETLQSISKELKAYQSR